jgi:hypothetical protein
MRRRTHACGVDWRVRSQSLRVPGAAVMALGGDEMTKCLPAQFFWGNGAHGGQEALV